MQFVGNNSKSIVNRQFAITLLLGIFVFSSSVMLSPCAAAKQKVSRTARASRLTASRRNSAKALAEKIIQAYGGAEVVNKVAYSGSRSFGKVVDYSSMSNASNSFDCTELSKGEKMRIEINMMGVPETTGFNGQHGWIKQGEQLFETTKIMDMRIKDDLEHDGILLLLKLLKPNTKLELLGNMIVLGRPCRILKVTVGDGTPTLIYADQTSHLILKSQSEGIDAETGIATLKTYIYEDYQALSGTHIPYKITEYSGAKKVSEIVLSKIEDAEIDDQIFELPKSQTALLDPDQELTLPFDYLSNEIVTKARANNQEDLLFIVDTGATQSVIDTNEAKKLGGFKDSTLTMTTGSGSMSLGYMTLSGLTLDTLTLKNVQFAVADLSSFSQILGRRPSGLIGADILRRFLVTIDYENQEIVLTNPDSADVPPDAIVIPTKPSLGMSGILVEGELDGQKLPFLVDSGAAFNNISTKLARPILQRSSVPVIPLGTVQGLDGKKVNIGSVQFNQLKIGPLTINGPVFSVAPSESNPSGVISTGDLAILGNPLWCRYKMTIDYKNERLILTQSEEVMEGERLVNQLQELESPGRGAPCEAALPGRGAPCEATLPGRGAPCEATLPGRGAPCEATLPGRGAPCAPADTIVRLKVVLAEAEEKDLPGVAALCLANIASATAEQELGKSGHDTPIAQTKQTEEQFQKISALFQEAEDMANQSEAKQIQAQILAKWAMYYLTYLPKTQAIQSAKPLLNKAASCWGTEPSVFTATSVMLRQMHQDRLADKLVDQALMLNPVDREALWLKYDLAKTQGNATVQKLVAEQLNRYFSPANIH